MTPIKALSSEHLSELIDENIAEHGNDCSLNHIDVSAVTDMDGLFQNIDFQGDISQWNTTNVTLMTSMFECSIFNGDLSQWDTSKVRSFSKMFKQRL